MSSFENVTDERAANIYFGGHLYKKRIGLDGRGKRSGIRILMI